MEQDLILAHDVGTRRAKSVLVTTEGALVGSVVHGYRTSHPRPGWAERDPLDWWAAVVAGTRALLGTHAVGPERVRGLVFSGQMLGIVPIDRRGAVLRPAIIWMDARAQHQADRLMRKLLGPRLFRAVVAAASGNDAVPKLLWLSQHEPQLFQDTAAFLDVNGYLVHRCTGYMVSDWTAVSVTGLLDFKRKRWNTLLARFVGAPIAKLPPPVCPTDIVGGLLGAAAGDLGLHPGTPVICGAGDVPGAAVGAGAVREGDGHIYLGTSGWVGVCSRRYRKERHGIATIQSASGQLCLLLAETQAAGACLQWVGETFFSADGALAGPELYRALDSAIEHTPAGADRLLFAPWLVGERAPVSDLLARGAFVNLGLHHERRHMVRAACEGVALNLRWILDILRDDFQCRPTALRLLGGGATSPLWAQIIADVTGCRIERLAAARDAGAVGAALIAAKGLGVFQDFEQLRATVEIDRVFTPRDPHRAVYDDLYSAYRQLYPALGPLYHGLNRHLANPVI